LPFTLVTCPLAAFGGSISPCLHITAFHEDNSNVQMCPDPVESSGSETIPKVGQHPRVMLLTQTGTANGCKLYPLISIDFCMFQLVKSQWITLSF